MNCSSVFLYFSVISELVKYKVFFDLQDIHDLDTTPGLFFVLLYNNRAEDEYKQ